MLGMNAGHVGLIGRSRRAPAWHRGRTGARVRVGARECGYRELASDALLDAIDSQRAHQSLGFIEVERAVRYRKRL
jgi:hypothetical protein